MDNKEEKAFEWNASDNLSKPCRNLKNDATVEQQAPQNAQNQSKCCGQVNACSLTCIKNEKAKNGYAVTSMVLGIVSASLSVLCCSVWVLYVFTLAAAAVGLIFGIIALVKKQSLAKAITGTVLSSIAVVLSFMMIFIFVYSFIGLSWWY